MNCGLEKACLQPAIRGKIADLLDYPVASARVVLSGSKLAEKLCTMTGIEGYFMFSRIPPGTYTLEVNYSGFSKLVQRGIAVQEHAITGLGMKMDFLEASRSLKLQALSLEYVNDAPEAENVVAPSLLTRQLREVMDGLCLERALFSPPPSVSVGRRLAIEFGIYQSLKDEIIRHLLEWKIDLFSAEQIEVTLMAHLQAEGCLVIPNSLPRVEVNGARYVEWRWEVLPRVPGRGLLCLSLDVRVNFAGRGEQEKRLLSLEREVRIKRSLWVELRRLLKP